MATFATPVVSTIKMKVNINAGGNIAQSGETAKSTKDFSITGFPASNESIDDAKKLFDTILGIAGGSCTTEGVSKNTTQGASE